MAERSSIDVWVVGAGAAGLLAALAAARRGRSVGVLEANPKAGSKIRISGGGRCNVTHAGGARAILEGFSKSQARFLGEALRVFPPEALLELLARGGLKTEPREDGRVFPVGGAGTGAQVVDVLLQAVQAAGVRLHFGRRVTGLEARSGRVEALVMADGSRLAAPACILACGGASYPETGTRGEALGWLEALGLPVRPWQPALAPIPLARPRPAWEGVALRGGHLRLRREAGGRVAGEAAGDLVFTRRGISGPAALALSEAVEALRREGLGYLTYDLTGTSTQAVEAELVAAQSAHPHLALRSWLHRHLPERICGDLLEGWGAAPDARLRDLPRDLRRQLALAVTDLDLGAAGAVPLQRGEVCAGGLSLKAVDPKTCRVKALPNLQVCGELLDLNGAVGGYNLQAAFSTGYLAGTCAGD